MDQFEYNHLIGGKKRYIFYKSQGTYNGEQHRYSRERRPVLYAPRRYNIRGRSVYENRLSVVYEDLSSARETLDRVRNYVSKNPTVYCGTHTPQGYENLEAKRIMDLDNPVETQLADVSFDDSKRSGKYLCSICGYVYDPKEHDGVAFEDLPEDWVFPRCRQGKDKFNAV